MLLPNCLPSRIMSHTVQEIILLMIAYVLYSYLKLREHRFKILQGSQYLITSS